MKNQTKEHDQQRKFLDQRLVEFNQSTQSLFDDPIELISSDLSAHDTEVISFLVAGLSYGRVEQIKKSTDKLFQCLHTLGLRSYGEGISDYLKNTPTKERNQDLSKALKNWKHRLNTAQDIVDVSSKLSIVIEENFSLANYFQSFEKLSPKEQIVQFVCGIMGVAQKKKIRDSKSKWKGAGAHWFASSPLDGGTCKRLLMWLRWMIRQDDFDLGTWQKPELYHLQKPRPQKNKLFVPLDTHVFRWASNENIVTRKSLSWKSVEEVTSYFQLVNPDDPLKYDFMICHEGMRVFRNSR